MAALLREEEERELRYTIALFDKDGSGKLSRDDIATIVRSTGCNPTEQELLEMFQSIDSDGMVDEGKIDVEEFLEYYARKLYDPVKDEFEEANDAFKQFDKNGEGLIEVQQLKTIMTNLGEDKLSDAEFWRILKEVEIDEEGKIDYSEFSRLMNQRYK